MIYKNLSLISFIFVLFASCNSLEQIVPTDNSELEIEEPRELVFSTSSSPLNFDPVHAITSVESQMYTAIYEGLLTYHPLTLEPLPAMAYDWKISEDGKVYTFYIREAARYNNGDPVKAQDFKDSWLRMVDPKYKAEYSVYFEIIQGIKDYKEGKISADEVGIKALDDKTLEVRLETPATHFLKLLCHMSFINIHPDYINKDGWGNRESIISNGPFMIESREKNKIRFVKNPMYWDEKDVQLETVTLLLSDDDKLTSEIFNIGNVHWTSQWDPSVDVESSAFVLNPLFATTYFFFRSHQEPYDNPDIRKALFLLLPLAELREDTLQLGTSRLIAKLKDYPDFEGLVEQDTEQAMTLLEQAGYPEGKGLPPLVIRVTQKSQPDKDAILMKKTWKDSINLEVIIESIPYDSYFNSLKEEGYQIGSMTWIGDYADPLTFLQMWTSDSNLNDAKYSNPEFDSIINDSLGKTGKERYEALAEAEKILLNNAVILPIKHFLAFNLIHLQTIDGWFPNVLDIHPFKYIQFKEQKILPGIVNRPQGSFFHGYVYG